MVRKVVVFLVIIGYLLIDNEMVFEIVIYDIVEINIGEGYDFMIGIFRVLELGVYVF